MAAKKTKPSKIEAKSRWQRAKSRLTASYHDLKKRNRLVAWLAEQRDVYPVMVFSIVPALIFWTGSNIDELGWSLMVRPLFWMALIGVLIYIVWYFIFSRNKFKASLMAIISVILAYNYSQIFEGYQKLAKFVLHLKHQPQSQAWFMLLLLVVYAGIIYLVVRKVKFSQTTRNYLALVASILLIYNLIPLLKSDTENKGASTSAFGADIKVIKKTAGQKPDIYYIVPEDYGNEKTFKNIFHFDNSDFMKYLKSKGFYDAYNSTANYPFTTFSLSTALNLDYIPKSYHNRPDSGALYKSLKDDIQNNKAALFLKSQGYKFVNLGSWWDATKYNKNADYDLYDRTGIVVGGHTIDMKEHELLLLQKTVAWPFFKKELNVGQTKIIGLTYRKSQSSPRAIQIDNFNHQIETLKRIPSLPSPKFIFTQFMVPHPPYVFDKDCNLTKEIKNATAKQDDQQFLQQVQCVNLKLKETIDYILAHSRTKPVVILQTDEGPYPDEFRDNRALDWTKQSPALLHWKADILNAYYFPDGDYSKLYPTISPVNSFRVIFNKYLGTDLNRLDDRYYFQESEKRRFFLNDLTEKFGYHK